MDPERNGDLYYMSKPFIIGIAGGTCSGKSTLSDALEAKLSGKKIRVMHMDSYFKNPTPTTVAPVTGTVYPEHNHPDSLRLPELLSDFSMYSESENLDVLIIEGLFALYIPEIREKLDLKIFVDLDSDERLVRRIVKHMKRGDSYDQVTSRYVETVKFRHNELIEPTRWQADIVVNGNYKDISLDIIMTYIEKKI